MATIKYTITFHTDWHCGSGLAAGADLDALVVKDDEQMPFVPGKTIKGLIREATFDFLKLTGNYDEESFVKAFGNAPEEGEEPDKLKKGDIFFTNATIDDSIYKQIVDTDSQRFLFRKKTSTSIDDEGTAKEHSLRSMQTTVAMELGGEILEIPEGNMKDAISNAMGFIKSLGQGRNRGLGRCTFSVIN